RSAHAAGADAARRRVPEVVGRPDRPGSRPSRGGSVRAALILPPQFPNGPKLSAQTIDTTYYPVAEPGQVALTAAALDERRKYWRVGIMRDPSWVVSRAVFDSQTDAQKVTWAKECANLLSEDITRLASPSFFSSAGSPKQ